jgi:hypothetical protein
VGVLIEANLVSFYEGGKNELEGAKIIFPFFIKIMNIDLSGPLVVHYRTHLDNKLVYRTVI